MNKNVFILTRILILFVLVFIGSSCNQIKLDNYVNRYKKLEKRLKSVSGLHEKKLILKEYEKLNWDLANFTTIELQKENKKSKLFRESVNWWLTVSKKKDDLLNEIKNTSGSQVDNEEDEEIYIPDSKVEIKQFNKKDIIDKTLAPYKLSNYDLNIIKNIYYDPNPDPESKEGTICGSTTRNCKWCSNSYNVDQKFTTYKSLIQQFTNPITAYSMFLASALTNSDEMKNAFHEICNNYINGKKYVCDTDFNPSEFCSLKCANEYKYK